MAVILSFGKQKEVLFQGSKKLAVAAINWHCRGLCPVKKNYFLSMQNETQIQKKYDNLKEFDKRSTS